MNGPRPSLSRQAGGVLAALFAATLLGWAPIFGKMAYRAGVEPYTLVALRTLLAAMLLWVFYLARWRAWLRIGWRDLLGCIGMGVVNGLGSLAYYTGLQRLEASLASLLNALYPVWVFIFLSSSGHEITRKAVARLVLVLVGLYLVTGAGFSRPDSLGVMLMLASAAAYGWHLVLGQWVLADVPARTVTIYVLTTMAVVVGVARVSSPLTGISDGRALDPITCACAGTGSAPGWEAIVGLAVVTALSRLLMFTGLGRLGGAQAALLGIMELVTTLLVAFVVLSERMSTLQWVGAVILAISVLMMQREKAAAASGDV
jgi:drug/metabolite transporter (DMT)-like permease